MRHDRPPRRCEQQGLSMVEALVAITVMVVAGTIALLIYDAARRSFKKGENLSEQQQAVRIAFDELVSDLRLAGFNYNPDGDKLRPDEQIEAAYDTAIVIRADFDAEDPAQASSPEGTLAGSSFLAVSTGNDEIVIFALAKPDGTGPDTLTFFADVQEAQRDGDVELVSVPNVVLVQNDPPYTLYRITLNNDPATYGTSSFFTRTPVVENIRSLRFRYYDSVGTQLNTTFDLDDPSDDIGGAETTQARNARGAIRRIQVELEGLTREPDLGWADPDDSDPETREYRKFQLVSDVTPRNLGMVGIRDLQSDLVPPSKPARPTLVPGHCGGLYLVWTPNPPEDQVTSYRIHYGTASGNYTGQRTVAGTSYYLSGLSDGTTYYVALQAADAAGNLSVMSNEASATTSNTNTPAAPEGLTATTDLNGAVRAEWNKVTKNTSAVPAGDPSAPAIRDLAGYRLYRSETAGFGVGVSSRIADESTLRDASAPSYIDRGVVNCRPHYYRVTAVDACGVESAPSDEVQGLAVSRTPPATPQNVQAFITGAMRITVSWNTVTQDVEGNAITVDTYHVFRSMPIPEGVLPTDASSFEFLARVKGATQYVDRTAAPLGYTYWYAVSALDDCPNESARSAPAQASCAFSGDVVFLNPRDGATVAGVVPVRVAVQNGNDTYQKLELTFYHEERGQVEDREEIDDPGPTWTYHWLADPPGPYTITATVTNTLGCSKSATIQVSAGTSVGCCLSPPDPDLNPIVLDCTRPGPPPQECMEITYQMINNNCLTAVQIEAMTITWADNVGNGAKLTGVRFDGNLIWNVSPPSPSPASNTFSSPKPAIGVERDSTNPVSVTYVYDQVTSAKVRGEFRRNELTTSYDFVLLDELGQPTSITGTCGPSTGMFDNMIVEEHN